MSDFTIRADGLGKQYTIGRTRERYRTLRDTIVETVTNPFRRKRGEAGSPQIWALRDVSFEAHRGDVIGVVGRNGAGKSTLLKVLSRITEPTAGSAELRGRVGSLLEVGTGFHPELSGRENIYLNAAILGMKRSEIVAQFDRIVSFAEVEKFIDTPVKRYSSGMYLRLAFAVAAHLDLEILLVDEILAVGDAEFQKKCLGKMEEVAGAGRTVLFVSHNMAAVQRLCTRGLFLRDGRIEADGSVGEVVSTYLQAGGSRLGERTWMPETAPGDEVVRLRSVRALDAANQIAELFKVTEPFSLEIEFDVLQPGHRLDAALYAYDQAGSLVFVTGDFQATKWRDNPRPVGAHRSRCRVPAHLLNEGRLSLLAAVATNPHTLHAMERDAITIEIVEDMESQSGARGNYSREWPGGTFRPLLEWSFDYDKEPC